MGTTEKNDVGEGQAFISRRGKPKTGCESFQEFLYDKHTGKVMGRTCLSWFYITVFYLIFYACLAGFFAICVYVFVLTMDDKLPKFYGKGSIIGINPGLGYQPWLEDDAESTLILFNPEDSDSYDKYVKKLNATMQRYKNTENTVPCSGNEDIPENVTQKACQVNIDEFGECTEANGFGYSDGKPCVALSLNRLIEWEPVAYPAGSEPDQVKKRYKSGDIAVNCEGEYHADQDSLGKVTYSPQSGFKRYYFPYRKYANYHAPLVFVQFTDLPEGQLVMVECKAYAYNIIHDRSDKLGMVHFELLKEFKEDKDKEE